MIEFNTQKEPLVYGVVADMLVLLPKSTADYLVATLRAIQNSRTWGEFKKNAPAEAYQEVVEILEENAEEEPPAKEPFDSDDILDYTDGDWPEWPAQLMLYWIPKDIQKTYGVIQVSSINGDFLEISPAREQQVVKAFEERGYTCLKDDRLVNIASGF